MIFFFSPKTIQEAIVRVGIEDVTPLHLFAHPKWFRPLILKALIKQKEKSD